MPAENQTSHDLDGPFIEAERDGLRLAIKGRTVALILFGLFLIVTRSIDPDRSLLYALVIGFFVLLGVAHYLLIGSRYDRRWVKYVFVTVDVALLSAMIATQPIYDTIDVPQTLAFRNSTFPYYFIILAVAAFSFSPGMVLWTGVAGAAGWLSAFQWAVRDMPVTLSWTDIGPSPTTEHFLEVFLSPNFVAGGSRVQEALALLLVAALIAVVMYRARRTVRLQLALDEERRAISEIFGQYVPRAVADTLIDDRGALEPVERNATVLFADIAGFTNMTESAGPTGVVAILNAYFDTAARIISDHGGIITQFQGDGILATFNVPVEDADHAQRAVRAALEIRKAVAEETFHGAAIGVRVGVCTGPVVAGNVGGGGRQSYTVHGDTVNLASRLEALNKEHGTEILVGASTVDVISEDAFNRICEVQVRGLSAPVAVYTPKAG